MENKFKLPKISRFQAGIFIVLLLMVISLWNGVDFIGNQLYHNWLKGFVEMLAMEVALLFLIAGFIIRKRTNKPIFWYVASEVYVVGALTSANYFQLMDTFVGKQSEWILSMVWASNLFGLVYGAALPILVMVIVGIVVDIAMAESAAVQTLTLTPDHLNKLAQKHGVKADKLQQIEADIKAIKEEIHDNDSK